MIGLQVKEWSPQKSWEPRAGGKGLLLHPHPLREALSPSFPQLLTPKRTPRQPSQQTRVQRLQVLSSPLILTALPGRGWAALPSPVTGPEEAAWPRHQQHPPPPPPARLLCPGRGLFLQTGPEAAFVQGARSTWPLAVASVIPQLPPEEGDGDRGLGPGASPSLASTSVQPWLAPARAVKVVPPAQPSPRGMACTHDSRGPQTF